MAIENLFYNGLEARLRFAPKINKEMFRGLITVTGAWGVAEQVVQGNEQRVSIKLEKGELNVRVIEVEAFGKDVKSLEVYIDGTKVNAKYSIVGNFMRIDLGSQQKVSKGIEIRIVYT
jgi:hypothetical protein